MANAKHSTVCSDGLVATGSGGKDKDCVACVENAAAAAARAARWGR